MIWGVGGSGNGNVVSMKLRFTESSMPKEPNGRAASEGNLSEGTLSEGTLSEDALSEDTWPCTMRVVG